MRILGTNQPIRPAAAATTGICWQSQALVSSACDELLTQVLHIPVCTAATLLLACIAVRAIQLN
jgi:hypothetical protein